MKALFLIFHGFQAANGISKKILYQVHALEANGMETHLCYLSDEHGIKCRMIDQEVLANYGTGLKGKLYKRLEFNSIVRYAIKNHINLVYIRTDHNANPFTVRLVKKIKNKKSRDTYRDGNSNLSIRSRIYLVFYETTIIY